MANNSRSLPASGVFTFEAIDPRRRTRSTKGVTIDSDHLDEMENRLFDITQRCKELVEAARPFVEFLESDPRSKDNGPGLTEWKRLAVAVEAFDDY